MTYSVYTDRGQVRERNEDSLKTCSLGKDGIFAVVCDGMGGENAGEVASSLACDIITTEVMKKYTGKEDESELKGILLSAISSANNAVFDSASANAEYSGMGTTVVAALIKKNSVLFAHAGDSRGYVVSGDSTVKQITRDHSLVRELVDRGLITETQAQTHPDKNLITRALGVQAFIDVEFTDAVLGEGDCVLLCSDGLTNFVSDDGIADIINNCETAVAARLLVEKANENGGGDNISAVVFKYDC